MSISPDITRLFVEFDAGKAQKLSPQAQTQEKKGCLARDITVKDPITAIRHVVAKLSDLFGCGTIVKVGSKEFYISKSAFDAFINRNDGIVAKMGNIGMKNILSNLAKMLSGKAVGAAKIEVTGRTEVSQLTKDDVKVLAGKFGLSGKEVQRVLEKAFNEDGSVKDAKLLAKALHKALSAHKVPDEYKGVAHMIHSMARGGTVVKFDVLSSEEKNQVDRDLRGATTVAFEDLSEKEQQQVMRSERGGVTVELDDLTPELRRQVINEFGDQAAVDYEDLPESWQKQVDQELAIRSKELRGGRYVDFNDLPEKLKHQVLDNEYISKTIELKDLSESWQHQVERELQGGSYEDVKDLSPEDLAALAKAEQQIDEDYSSVLNALTEENKQKKVAAAPGDISTKSFGPMSEKARILDTIKQLNEKNINAREWAQNHTFEEAQGFLKVLTGEDLEGRFDTKIAAKRYVESFKFFEGKKATSELVKAEVLLKDLLDVVTGKDNWNRKGK